MIRLLTLLALPFFAVLSAAPVARPNIVLITVSYTHLTLPTICSV